MLPRILNHKGLRSFGPCAVPLFLLLSGYLFSGHDSEDWQVLFDGTSTSAWREVGTSEFPDDVWIMEDDCLRLVSNTSDGKDIITLEQYGDFELTLEWKISKGGNSGIKYLVQEGGHAAELAGLRKVAAVAAAACVVFSALLFLNAFRRRRRWLIPVAAILAGLSIFGLFRVVRISQPVGNAIGLEFQLYDDWEIRQPDRNLSTGALYDLIAPVENVVNPPGEFNSGKIIVRGFQVEHWINGTRVLGYQLNSEELAERIANSKFKGYLHFGEKGSGHIALQNHGDAIWFRSIKIRPL